MTPHAEKEKPVTGEECDKRHKEITNSASGWRNVLIFLFGLAAAAIGTQFMATSAQSARIAGQEAKIEALQRTDDLLRADLQEIKTDLKTLLRAQGAKP